MLSGAKHLGVRQQKPFAALRGPPPIYPDLVSLTHAHGGRTFRLCGGRLSDYCRDRHPPMHPTEAMVHPLTSSPVTGPEMLSGAIHDTEVLVAMKRPHVTP